MWNIECHPKAEPLVNASAPPWGSGVAAAQATSQCKAAMRHKCSSGVPSLVKEYKRKMRALKAKDKGAEREAKRAANRAAKQAVKSSGSTCVVAAKRAVLEPAVASDRVRLRM